MEKLKRFNKLVLRYSKKNVFIQFDIKIFYPSITEEQLNKTLDELNNLSTWTMNKLKQW